MPEKGDSQKIRVLNGKGPDVVKIAIGALVGVIVSMLVGQFVPTIQGVAALRSDLDNFREEVRGDLQEIRKDIQSLEDEVEKSVREHAEAPAHAKALELILDHEKRLSGLEGKQ